MVEGRPSSHYDHPGGSGPGAGTDLGAEPSSQWDSQWKFPGGWESSQFGGHPNWMIQCLHQSLEMSVYNCKQVTKTLPLTCVCRRMVHVKRKGHTCGYPDKVTWPHEHQHGLKCKQLRKLPFPCSTVGRVDNRYRWCSCPRKHMEHRERRGKNAMKPTNLFG